MDSLTKAAQEASIEVEAEGVEMEGVEMEAASIEVEAHACKHMAASLFSRCNYLPDDALVRGPCKGLGVG